MEKKVPERKVSLREEDVFYVYDKRINRCIKEDCEGNVKYGLVLRVSVSDEETINCFECNKCHMKYTPYPNYVRLTNTDMLDIYNKEEVVARDKKRAEDAAKQAAREKRKNMQTRGGFGRTASEKRPYERRNFDKNSGKNFEKKPYERKSYERSSYEKNSFEKRAYDKKAYAANFQPNMENGKARYSNSNGGYKKPFSSESRVNTGTGTRKSNVVIVSGNYKKSGFGDKPYREKSYGEKNGFERNNHERAYNERKHTRTGYAGSKANYSVNASHKEHNRDYR